MMAMSGRFYNRIVALAESPSAYWWLALISCAESSVFPIPPDVLLVPMCLARPALAYRFAAVCTVASVLGGVVGYAIGYAMFDQIAKPIIELYGYGTRFEGYQACYREWGLWIILIKGLTPIPYKIVTIASGAASFSFAVFVAASLVTRGARFFLEGWLLHRYGDWARDFIERRLTLALGIAAVLVVGGFVAARYLFGGSNMC
jgi:membrane protein YqaA with SNARE-associated domain